MLTVSDLADSHDHFVISKDIWTTEHRLKGFVVQLRVEATESAPDDHLPVLLLDDLLWLVGTGEGLLVLIEGLELGHVVPGSHSCDHILRAAKRESTAKVSFLEHFWLLQQLNDRCPNQLPDFVRLESRHQILLGVREFTRHGLVASNQMTLKARFDRGFTREPQDCHELVEVGQLVEDLYRLRQLWRLAGSWKTVHASRRNPLVRKQTLRLGRRMFPANSDKIPGVAFEGQSSFKTLQDLSDRSWGLVFLCRLWSASIFLSFLRLDSFSRLYGWSPINAFQSL